MSLKTIIVVTASIAILSFSAGYGFRETIDPQFKMQLDDNKPTTAVISPLAKEIVRYYDDRESDDWFLYSDVSIVTGTALSAPGKNIKVRLSGVKGNSLQLEIKDSTGDFIADCSAPCQTVRVRKKIESGGWNIHSIESLPTYVIHNIISDALAGNLERHLDTDGTAKWLNEFGYIERTRVQSNDNVE